MLSGRAERFLVHPDWTGNVTASFVSNDDDSTDTGAEPETSGSGSEDAIYDESDKSELTVVVDDVGDYWSRLPEDNSGYRALHNADRTATVINSVTVYQQSSEAASRVEGTLDGDESATEFDVADNAVSREIPEMAIVTFRDPNAHSEIHAHRVSDDGLVPAVSLGQSVAEQQFERWQDEF